MQVERIEPGAPIDHQRAAALEGAVLTRDLDIGGERWRKGRRLTADEVRSLAVSIAADRPVTLLILGRGTSTRTQAALRLAAAIAGPGLVRRGPTESRVDLLAAHDGVLHVRTAALERVDRIDPLEVFTRLDGQVVTAGDLVASVKVAPHVVPAVLLEQAERIIGGRGLVRVAPWLHRVVGVVVKQALHAPARQRFEASVRQKVDGLDLPWVPSGMSPTRPPRCSRPWMG